MNTNKFKSVLYIEKTHTQFPSLHIDLSDSKRCVGMSGEQVSVRKTDFLWHPNDVMGLVAYGALAGIYSIPARSHEAALRAELLLTGVQIYLLLYDIPKNQLKMPGQQLRAEHMCRAAARLCFFSLYGINRCLSAENMLSQ